MKLLRSFPNSWQEDFHRSQTRFLPEPPPDPPCVEEPLIWKEGYWSILYVADPASIQRLRRHRWSELLWVSEKGHFCFAFPSILLLDV